MSTSMNPFYLCTTNPLNEDKVKLLKQRTPDLYQVNMILDNLPVRMFTKRNGITIQWTVRRDLRRYEGLDKKAQTQLKEEVSGWKLVVDDVFGQPTCSKLFCVMVGDGIQITNMVVVRIVFAALGLISPASRGMLSTGMIVLYLFLGCCWVSWSKAMEDSSQGSRSLSWSIVFLV